MEASNWQVFTLAFLFGAACSAMVFRYLMNKLMKQVEYLRCSVQRLVYELDSTKAHLVVSKNECTILAEFLNRIRVDFAAGDDGGVQRDVQQAAHYLNERGAEHYGTGQH